MTLHLRDFWKVRGRNYIRLVYTVPSQGKMNVVCVFKTLKCSFYTNKNNKTECILLPVGEHLRQNWCMTSLLSVNAVNRRGEWIRLCRQRQVILHLVEDKNQLSCWLWKKTAHSSYLDTRHTWEMRYSVTENPRGAFVCTWQYMDAEDNHNPTA